MSVLGKTLKLNVRKRNTGTMVDHTDDHGLGDVSVNITRSPIARPSSGDIAQFSRGSHKAVVISYPVESDADAATPVIDPLYLDTGTDWGEVDIEYAVQTQTGKKEYTGWGVIASCPLSNPNTGNSTFTVTINANTWVESTQS